MSDILLSAHNVCLEKKGKAILKNVELEIKASQITTLIGPNGAGKTSLVRLLLGLDTLTAGSINRVSGLTTAYVPQSVVVPQELPMRVRDFVMLAGNYSSEQVSNALVELEIEALADSAIQSISGGELQRVVLARALLKKPQLLVLDEPAQGLDVVGQQALYKTVSMIRDKHQCAVLMVSHDLHLVMAATDKVICLNAHVCCKGHPDDVSTHPEYLKLFGTALDGLAVYAHHHDHEHDMHGNILGQGHGHGDHSECSHD